ncbi:MAG: Trk system potassium uptake protein TrkA [Pseudomonadales bacterium]|nr:Trk system potassium uptake protein TrkA [Pseudomonadales bacterium]
MRIAIIGAGNFGRRTAQLLLARRHDVIVVDRNRERLDAVAAESDCGLVHGDGSRPALLRELDPAATGVLMCLTGNDQTNILASLVGRSLGFARVVTRIEDPEFEHVCLELGLHETIVPARAIGGVLADLAEGRDTLETTTIIRDVARVYSFVLHGHDGERIGALDLPDMTRVVCFYRDGEFRIPDDDTVLRDGDEVVVISHVRNLERLRTDWSLAGAPHSTRSQTVISSRSW